jgi:hypothetical protein
LSLFLRRTKQQVAPELPPRSEDTIVCELDASDRKRYNGLRDRYRASVLGLIAKQGVKKSQFHVLEALLRLRQAACHSGLIDPKRSGDSSAKVEALVERLVEAVAEGHKALVFSQFTSLLALVQPVPGRAGHRLRVSGWQHARPRRIISPGLIVTSDCNAALRRSTQFLRAAAATTRNQPE